MQVIIWTLGVILFLRLSLPLVTLVVVNALLKNNETFNGRVRRIKFNLIRGLVYIKGIQISILDKTSGIYSLRLRCDKIEIKLRISALFRRIIDANIVIDSPDLLYVKVMADQQEKGHDHPAEDILPLQESPIKAVLEKAIPFSVNLTFVNGRIRYVDHTSKAMVDVQVEPLQGSVRHFSNIPAHASEPARIEAAAKIFQGKWTAKAHLKPMEQFLTFGMEMSLEEAHLPLMNSIVRSLAKLNAGHGRLSIFIELDAQQGMFTGYIKPILRNVELVSSKDSQDSFLNKIWRHFVAVILMLLENNKTKQIATVVPVQGRFDNPNVGVVSAVVGVLKNAFVKRLRPTFRNALGFAR